MTLVTVIHLAKKNVLLRHFVHMHAEVRVVMAIDCFADRIFLPRYILTCLCISMTFESCRFGVILSLILFSLFIPFFHSLGSKKVCFQHPLCSQEHTGETTIEESGRKLCSGHFRSDQQNQDTFSGSCVY